MARNFGEIGIPGKEYAHDRAQLSVDDRLGVGVRGSAGDGGRVVGQGVDGLRDVGALLEVIL